MNTNRGFSQMAAILAIVAVLVVGGAAWALTARDKVESPEGMESQDNMMTDENSQESMSDDSMEKKDDQAMDQGDAMMDKPGTYKDYSSATVEAEQSAGNKVVLFFHASWCPFCKAANTAFLERASEIPAGVTVLKTDYDSNIALRQKYGVTYQHTFVQIDNDENQVSKWNGGDIDNLKKYLK